MKHWKLTQWCVHATGRIRYSPDRKAVHEELRQHLDDRSDGFLAKGFSEEEAIEKTLDAIKKGNNITLLTLEKICTILECTPNEVVKFIK